VSEEESGWLFSGRCLRIRPIVNKIDSNFLFYYFSTEMTKETMRRIAVGATMPSINTELLSNLIICFPSLPTQRAIAEVLSSLDDKIGLLTRQNATLEMLVQAYFRKWFLENGKEQKTVGNFIASTIGGEWGQDSNSETYSMPVYCLRGTDIAMLSGGLATKAPCRYIKPTKYEKIALTNRDIILEISGGTDTQSTGRVMYINDSVKSLFDLPIIFSNFCRCLRLLKEEYLYPIYLYIKGKWENNEFFNLENGSSGIHNLDYKAFLFTDEYSDVFPNDTDFIEFSKFVNPLFEKIGKNKTQIQTLQKLRDTLLPKLISGEVRVNQ